MEKSEKNVNIVLIVFFDPTSHLKGRISLFNNEYETKKREGAQRGEGEEGGGRRRKQGS